MDMKIPPHIIETLVNLGKKADTADGDLSEMFEVLRPYEYLNSLHWRDWHLVCDSLAVENHEALLKALTLAEHYGVWRSGGSVSAVIWVYHRFEDRVPYQTACKIARWIIDRCENPYAPFGGPGKRSNFLEREGEYCGKTTGKLMMELIMAENAIKYERDRYQSDQQQKAKADRIRRKQRISDEHSQRKNELDGLRKGILAEGANLDPIGRLHLIINQPDIPIFIYPAEWSEVGEDIISAISEPLREQLLARLGNLKRGPWRRLHQKLSKFLA